jgi:hypothetical protein
MEIDAEEMMVRLEQAVQAKQAEEYRLQSIMVGALSGALAVVLLFLA